AYSVAVGDFNGDGNADIATVLYGDSPVAWAGSAVSVRLANGAGGFGAATSFPVGNGPEWVTTGDFNGDGKLDLATANFGGSSISILLGNGSGGFGPAMTFGAGSGPVFVLARDLNGDGKLDLAIANSDAAGTISILLGTGTGSF